MGYQIFQSMVPRSLAFGAQAALLLIQCYTLLKKKLKVNAYLKHDMEKPSGVDKTNVVHQEGNCPF